MKRMFAGLLLSALVAGAAAPVWAQAQQPQTFTSAAGKGGTRDEDAIRRGKEISAELGWPSPFPLESLDPEFSDFTAQHVFAGLFGRDGLSVRERELIIMAIIMTQGAGSGITPHLASVAPRLGISERNVREVIYTTCVYAGWPKCAPVITTFDRILKSD